MLALPLSARLSGAALLPPPPGGAAIGRHALIPSILIRRLVALSVSAVDLFSPTLRPATRRSDAALSSILALSLAVRLPGAVLVKTLSHRAVGRHWGMVDECQHAAIIRK